MKRKGMLTLNSKQSDKCETCVKSMITKKHYQSVKMVIMLQELKISDETPQYNNLVMKI